MVKEQTIIKAANTEIKAGIIEYCFDVIKEHSITMQNNITDNYLENNTAVQDTIAKSPLTITISGLAGELVYVYSDTKLYEETAKYNANYQAIDTIKKLDIIPALLPPVDNVTRLARDKANLIEASVNRLEKILNTFEKIDYSQPFNMQKQALEQTRLKQVYETFEEWRNTDTPLIAETPYGIFNNMYIQTVTLRQGNENYITDIQLTLKQLNFANIEYTETDKNVVAKYLEAAKAEEVNCGKTTGVEVKHSMVKAFVHYLLK